MLAYFIHYDDTADRWHVVYRIPGTNGLSSVVDCPSQSSAAEQRLHIMREADRERQSLVKVFDQQRRLLPRRFNNEIDD